MKTLLDHLHKFSDWSRLEKAIARLKHLAKEVKGLKPRSCEAASREERREAKLTIIKMVQEATLAQEIQYLRQHKEIQNKSKLHRLDPFLDDKGIIKVGGRLSHAALHPRVKHPAVLPRNSHISSLLVKHYHERVHHQGRGMTTNEFHSSGIWILGCSSLVSSHICKCTKCRKFRRGLEPQRMSDLPVDRTEAFTYCGMDCFIPIGPFYIKEGRRELIKYGLILTCMCSRAIHIEMLDDLTSDAFINALRSFISIRGAVWLLRCDQGKNFFGARRT